MNRKKFVTQAITFIGALNCSTIRSEANSKGLEFAEKIRFKKKVLAKIGICADIHHDQMHDGERRLKAFIDEMNILKPDFIIQLGDFCSPQKKNIPFLNIWNNFHGPSYHVIGNHDTDYGFTHQQVVDFWNANGIYYSFERNGYHFIVLNGNERKEGDTSRWPSYINQSQLDWLENDLNTSILPVIIFCHQGLDVDVNGAIEQATRVRVLLDRINSRAGYTRVQLVFSGHHHQDYCNIINGIHYIQINSMAYYWLGERYRTLRYSDAVDKAYPFIKDSAPYKDPIWAYLTIYNDFSFEIKGKKTEFVSPSPYELGFKEFEKVYPVVPYISDRKIKM